MFGFGFSASGFTDPGLAPGLLDFYPATAAYSLRKLRHDYTGAAIRVRRESDNTEQNIGFSGKDLDTAALASFCTGTNGFVVTWYDQQGANNATQSTAGSQPKIYDSSTGVVLENGKPAVQFNGVDYFLKASSSISNYPITNTIVQKNDPANAGHSWSLNNDASSIQYYSNTDFSSISIIFHNVRNSANVFFSQAWPSAIQNTMFSYSKASNDHAFAVNGGMLNTSTTTTTFPNANNIVIGRLRLVSTGLFYNGLVQELIVWASDQSANRTSIEANINDYYSIYP